MWGCVVIISLLLYAGEEVRPCHAPVPGKATVWKGRTGIDEVWRRGGAQGRIGRRQVEQRSPRGGKVTTPVLDAARRGTTWPPPLAPVLRAGEGLHRRGRLT